MKSSILSIGTELLFGQITNTNTVYLSQQLNLLGIDVLSHLTIGDNPKRMFDILSTTIKDSDIIITTGGLGPTQDDMTKEVVCQVLEDELVAHKESMDKLENYFKRLNRQMTENNWKQGYFPSRAIVFDNEMGTAPGFALENKGKHIICLPGPPAEMKNMFTKHVMPYLEKMTDSAIYYKIIRFFGIGESMLETKLIDLVENQSDPTLATYAKTGECSVRVASKRQDTEEAKKAVDEMIGQINEIVGEYIYSTEDIELHQIVADKLMKKNITISAAESCTGGMFAEVLTSISGISKVFDRSIVSYSNQAKIDELGVKKETIDTYGAVSEETAIEMAKGIKKVANTRMAISVTGVAGPLGGSPDKPVGLVYICLILDDIIVTKESRIRNVNRNWNRNYTTLTMFDMINRLLDGREQD